MMSQADINFTTWDWLVPRKEDIKEIKSLDSLYQLVRRRLLTVLQEILTRFNGRLWIMNHSHFNIGAMFTF